ncbi:MAG: hypothetical protein LUE20_05130 [Oscillospiraceae bacterium]|nr:hypothetical protein [Oscillospiraceae bacterium]
MKTVAIVPMKLNNRRLPRKNTKCFTNGKPLCYYILSTLLAVDDVDEVYVYCSNPDIQEFIPDGVKHFESLDSVWRMKVDPELPLRHNKGAISSALCSNLQKRQDFFANIKVGNSFDHCANIAIGENGIKGVVLKLYRKVKSRFVNL